MPGRPCENASPREVMPWCRQQVTSFHRSAWDVPRCFLFLPCSSSSSSASPGDIPFTLTLKSTSRAPQIAQLGQDSPCPWQSQPVSSEESLPCLLSGTHASSGGVRTLLLPFWKWMVWEGHVAWWWHRLKVQPRVRCGPRQKALRSLFFSVFPSSFQELIIVPCSFNRLCPLTCGMQK